MFDKSKLKLEDVKSKGQPIEEYIESDKGYKGTRDQYKPNTEKIEKIKSILEKRGQKLVVKAFGAPWCGDCKIQLPRLAKVVEKIGENQIEVEVFTEIKTKPRWSRKEGEPIWKSPPSPPETTESKFDMKHIPAIYVFTTNGDCIGKIDESPEHTKTLEGDIYHYLQNIK